MRPRLAYITASLFVVIIFNLSTGCNVDSDKKPQFNSYQQAIDWYQNQKTLEIVYPNSSAIYRAAYHAADRILLINFTSNQSKSFIFGNISPDMWQAFKFAPSKGQYYNATIKGRYEYLL